jgi:hypothetical protein
MGFFSKQISLDILVKDKIKKQDKYDSINTKD